jgi:ankyrin repeat protein
MAGRTDEVKALLAQGVPVDAIDADGETALMKSIRAGQPAVAALLHARGASLQRENRAGQSARELAAEKQDPRIDAALGLDR